MLDDEATLAQIAAKGNASQPADTAHVPSGRLPPPGDWHVVAANYGQSAFAEMHIARAGWEVFQPMHLGRRANGEPRIEPLFPGYLFVRFGPGDDWPHILRCPGVHSLLGPPGSPSVVPAAAIENLRARTSPRRVVDDPVLLGYVAGEPLDVLSGPLAGFSGICTLSAPDRVRMLLEFLGRPVEISVPPGSVMRPAHRL